MFAGLRFGYTPVAPGTHPPPSPEGRTAMSSNEESREQGPLGFLPFLTQPSGEYGYPQGPGFAPVPPPLGPPPLGPLPERGPSVPPFPGLDREPFLETADSLTTEFLLHGKR